MSSTSLDEFLGIGEHGFGGSFVSKKLKKISRDQILMRLQPLYIRKKGASSAPSEMG